MVCGVECGANGRNVRLNTSRCFVVRGQNGFDLVVGVGLQNLCIIVSRNTVSPRRFNNLYIQSVPLAHIDPAM